MTKKQIKRIFLKFWVLWHLVRSFHIPPHWSPDDIPQRRHQRQPRDPRLRHAESWRDAAILFTIVVSEGEGDTVEYMCNTSVGDVRLKQSPEDYFRSAGFTPRLGKYEFKIDDQEGLVLTDVPEGTATHERRSLMMWLTDLVDLLAYFESYTTALRTFPRREVIKFITREVVSQMIEGSLATAVLQTVEVADPRTLVVRGVSNCGCGFSLSGRIGDLVNALMDMSSAEAFCVPSEHEGVRFDVARDRVDGKKALLVSYLSYHMSPFADLLNDELAKQVREMIPEITEQVLVEASAMMDIQRRALDNTMSSLQATFGDSDPEAVAARMNEVELKYREAMNIWTTPDAASMDPNDDTVAAASPESADDPIHNPPSTSDGADNSATSPAG
ncbi:hypothetical protein HQ487_03365 [Candidatus Uhrbacteria bacterium]|nr:hypothetical protein [Candidatus Uhrbacteria bacterium]